MGDIGGSKVLIYGCLFVFAVLDSGRASMKVFKNDKCLSNIASCIM